MSINYLKTLHLKAPESLKMRAVLVKNLAERFACYESSDLVSLASLLDPRIKRAAFKDAKHTDAAVAKLRAMVDETSRLNAVSTAPTVASDQNTAFDIGAMIEVELSSRNSAATKVDEEVST